MGLSRRLAEWQTFWKDGILNTNTAGRRREAEEPGTQLGGSLIRERLTRAVGRPAHLCSVHNGRDADATGRHQGPAVPDALVKATSRSQRPQLTEWRKAGPPGPERQTAAKPSAAGAVLATHGCGPFHKHIASHPSQLPPTSRGVREPRPRPSPDSCHRSIPSVGPFRSASLEPQVTKS